MRVQQFQISQSTKAKLAAGLQGLDQAQKDQILNAVADLCAEVQIHERTACVEELRQQWSDTLATMLRFGGK